MTLTLVREPSANGRTFGVLFVDGRFQCHTLEDVVRAEKIAGETAVPAGRYRVAVSWSPRFQRRLPLLENVPGFSGVRIHAGNSSRDTEGCILPGLARDGDRVVQSRTAFMQLLELLEAAGPTWLAIVSAETMVEVGGHR